jgi:hypothetical protein
MTSGGLEADGFCSASAVATGKCAQCTAYTGTNPCSTFGYVTANLALDDDSAAAAHCNTCSVSTTKILVAAAATIYGPCIADTACSTPANKKKFVSGDVYICEDAAAACTTNTDVK